MIVLDENILDAQRRLLESSHIAARQIGVNFGHKGLQDHEIVDLLRQHRGITFFTRDAGFFRVNVCHRSCCVVVLAVAQAEVFFFVRRLLREQSMRTKAQRMGSVVRVSHTGFSTLRINTRHEVRSSWSTR